MIQSIDSVSFSDIFVLSSKFIKQFSSFVDNLLKSHINNFEGL
ncbi:MAG: hypothetical protein Q8M44_01765 [bacterium]|nr:hypothetical protein [bacterium]